MNLDIEAAGRRRTGTIVGDPVAPPGRPLVLVFHGSKQDGATHRAFTGRALDRLAADGRAVIAYLDGIRGNWNDARRDSSFPARREGVDDVAFVHAAVAAIARSHGTDSTRTSAVGYSNGGQMVFRLLHESPALLESAVVVAATMPDTTGFTAGFSPEPVERGIPLTLVAGTADRIVPYGGGEMARWARTVFKVGGTALSAAETADYFAARNGIDPEPETALVPARDPEGARRGGRTTMERTSYRQAGRAPVTLVTVHGGGHTVPGRTPAPRILGRTGSDLAIDEMVSELLDGVRAV
jgi:polyhydroxybutyrate depolymerase